MFPRQPPAGLIEPKGTVRIYIRALLGAGSAAPMADLPPAGGLHQAGVPGRGGRAGEGGPGRLAAASGRESTCAAVLQKPPAARDVLGPPGPCTGPERQPQEPVSS